MLTIYRASAGTGKTHTLTGDYLRMLFAAPDAYRHILAVTFTNKATEEMKNRILSELYLLASGQSSDYTGMLTEAYRLTEQQLRSRARTTLIRILHDYSAFNVSTIDHFFQQTVRAFVCEIGLPGNYRIEMDRDLYSNGCFVSVKKRWRKVRHGTCVPKSASSATNCLKRITRLSTPK